MNTKINIVINLLLLFQYLLHVDIILYCYNCFNFAYNPIHPSSRTVTGPTPSFDLFEFCKQNFTIAVGFLEPDCNMSGLNGGEQLVHHRSCTKYQPSSVCHAVLETSVCLCVQRIVLNHNIRKTND